VRRQPAEASVGGTRRGRRWGVQGGHHGSAAVEFALVLPLVLILILAALQVALLTKDDLIVQGAARAGAREAAVTTDDASARQAAIEASHSLDPSRIEVLIQRDGGTGQPVLVTVRYRAPIAIPAVAWLFPSEVSLSATVSMRQETG
jgi:Flp pilus assembly protein TadG